MRMQVRAKYDYNSGHEDDLAFAAGQQITVTEEVDKEWYSGEYRDVNGVIHQGMFPRNFVTKLKADDAKDTQRPQQSSEAREMTRSQAQNQEGIIPENVGEAKPLPRQRAATKDVKSESEAGMSTVFLPWSLQC
jgi:myosin tail region-interacting protein MTI1